MMDEPEIERCVCGAEGTWHGVEDEWYAFCYRGTVECWQGPTCQTTEAAITAWNTLMRLAREKARLQAEIASSHADLIYETGYYGNTDVTHCNCVDCIEHRARKTVDDGV
jgi:hypothetical protein